MTSKRVPTTITDLDPLDLAVGLDAVLPSLGPDDGFSLPSVGDIQDYLGRFYLYGVARITLDEGDETPWRTVQDRYRTVLTAAHLQGLTVATVVTGEAGQTSLYVGVQRRQGADSAFRATLAGALPGLVTEGDSATFTDLLGEKQFGGTVVGVPMLRVDAERQQFDLATVARAAQGTSFTLAFISRPVDGESLRERVGHLLEVRDRAHLAARSTASDEEGVSEGSNWGYSSATGVSEGEATSEARGRSWGAGLSILVASANQGGSRTTTKTYNTGTSKTTTGQVGGSRTAQYARSLSREHQNGLAVEVERLADHHLNRMLRAGAVGLWATSIALATEDEASANVLAGALAAEIARPDTVGVPPAFTAGKLPEGGVLPLQLEATGKGGAVHGASLMTSEELALITAPPVHPLPGYDVRRRPRLALSSPHRGSGLLLGPLVDQETPVPACPFALSEGDLSKHVLVCGTTGSGKSTTVRRILSGLAGLPGAPTFLVVESAKRDYRQLLSDPAISGPLRVYTVGDPHVSPLRLNPFFVPPGAPLAWHIDALKSLFLASSSFYGPMPAILERCLSNVYEAKGWDLRGGDHPYLHSGAEATEVTYYSAEGLRCFPSLRDLRDEVARYIREDLDYRGELADNIRTALLVRLEALSTGPKGDIFDTYETVRVADLLSHPTVLELEPLADDDDKAFFLGLVLILVNEHRQLSSATQSVRRAAEGVPTLSHLLVIEEAHRLLKNVATERQSETLGNPKGKAVEMFCNVLAEMRSQGQGIVVVEQVPTKLAPDVVKNTNTKVVHRVVSGDDQATLSATMGLSVADSRYLAQLRTGRALCHTEGMERPAEVAVGPPPFSSPITDVKVALHMRALDLSPSRPDGYTNVRRVTGAKGQDVAFRLLCTLVAGGAVQGPGPVSSAVEDLRRLSNSSGRPHRFSDDGARDYLYEEMLAHLISGCFSAHFLFPKGTSGVVRAYLDGASTSGQLNTFREDLAALHGAESAEGLAADVVADALLIGYARSKRPLTDSDLSRLAAGYFYGAPAAAAHAVRRASTRILQAP